MNEEKETQEKKSYEVYTYYADVDGHSKEVQVGETITVPMQVDTPFGIYTTIIRGKITEDNLEALLKEGIVKKTLSIPTIDKCIDDFTLKNRVDKAPLLTAISVLPRMVAYIVLSSIMANIFTKDEYRSLWSKKEWHQLSTYDLSPTIFDELKSNKLPVFPNYRIAKYVSEEVKKYYKERISK